MKRIQDLLCTLRENDLDGILVSSEANITYLSGFTGDSSRLIVSKNAFLLTDARYTEQAKNECHKGITVIKWIDDERFGPKTFLHICNELNIKKLGIEENNITLSEYQRLNQTDSPITLINASGLIENQRLVKDEEEINNLRRACEISVEALEMTLPYAKTGTTELELAGLLEYNMKKCGSQGLSFDSIVLGGARSSLLHGKPGNRKLQHGDFLLFDFGALYNGYHADISRTFIIGKASTEQKDFYRMIQKAQQKSVESVRAGIAGAIPDKVVRDNLSEKYLAYYYPGLGHGVGLEIHELPFIRHSSNFRYKENMTITIEPGCYIPDWGGMRIEDSIVVKENEPEILTNFPRDLIEL
jgi:Xaa-Pro aminopeptidase